MSVQTVPVLGPTTTDDGDDLAHLICCDEDVAICGTDVSASRWFVDGEEVDCLVCLDLEDLPCERCGE